MPGSESPRSAQQSSNTYKQQDKPASDKKRTYQFIFGQQDDEILAGTNKVNGGDISHKKESNDETIINLLDELKAPRTIYNDKHLSSLSTNGLFQKRANNTLIPPAPITLAAFDIAAPQPLPAYEKNLAPEFYQLFLQELFKELKCNEVFNDILEFKKPEHLFVLTGSAAKQLQDSSQRNPNDIDILCYQDLHQARYALTMKLTNLDASIISDDLNGTLIINYKNKHFKLQLIDCSYSPQCFPPQKTTVDVDGVLMIESSIIPTPSEQSTLADEDPTLLIQLDELEPWQLQYTRCSPNDF